MVAIYVQGNSGEFCTGMLVNGKKHTSHSREVYTMSKKQNPVILWSVTKLDRRLMQI
ncbi:hypothetical protein T08_16223 [Trichinella sp. T8]|nr:hypothetical protein T08_16223 [Trichinella sp. T8]